jgi:hypothetical protein
LERAKSNALIIKITLDNTTYKLRGVIDIYVENTPIEIKTKTDKLPTTPEPKHIQQLLLYMFMTGTNKGILTYIKPTHNTLKTTTYKITVTNNPPPNPNTITIPVKEYIQTIHKLLTKGKKLHQHIQTLLQQKEKTKITEDTLKTMKIDIEKGPQCWDCPAKHICPLTLRNRSQQLVLFLNER